jgi:hypothetical protein
MEQKFIDGSKATSELIEMSSATGRKFGNITDTRFGDYVVIGTDGKLQFWNENGMFSTARQVTPPKIEVPSQPAIPKPPANGADSAVDAIRQLGGTCERGPGGAVEKVNLQGTAVSDADLAGLKSFPGLRVLNLKECRRLSDSGMRHLAGLANLADLDISYTGISDSGITHIGGLTNMECLSLWETKVTGSGLTHLTRMTHLKRLYLPRPQSQVSDGSVNQLLQVLPACTVYR